jgi:hypothetical protein
VSTQKAQARGAEPTTQPHPLQTMRYLKQDYTAHSVRFRVPPTLAASGGVRNKGAPSGLPRGRRTRAAPGSTAGGEGSFGSPSHSQPIAHARAKVKVAPKMVQRGGAILDRAVSYPVNAPPAVGGADIVV